jgi:hypothetical protein
MNAWDCPDCGAPLGDMGNCLDECHKQDPVLAGIQKLRGEGYPIGEETEKLMIDRKVIISNDKKTVSVDGIEIPFDQEAAELLEEAKRKYLDGQSQC